MVPAASIVFTAHNRRAMVLDAIALAKAQTVPLEIIVCDDASQDGLGEALAEAHPDVRYFRTEESVGPSFQRNRGVANAKSEIVFLLDDDSMLVSPQTVAQTLPDFEDPHVALVAMPFRQALQSDFVWQRRTGPDREVSVNYAACAHAVRKSAYQAVGGYPEDYFYMGEEGDLAIRLIDAGWRVVTGAADPIDHLQPPARRSEFAAYYSRRNLMLFQLRHSPVPTLPFWLIATVVSSLAVAWRMKYLRAMTRGLRDGLFKGLREFRLRGRVRSRTYAAFVSCKRAETMPLAGFEALLGERPQQA